MSKARLVTLPVTSAVPTQLVLGLDGVGIRKPRRKRSRGRHPWMPSPVERAA